MKRSFFLHTLTSVVSLAWAAYAVSQESESSPPIIRQTSFSTFSHWLVGISDLGRTLEIEDGSQWDIHYSDRYILNHWKRNDSILITPNYDWFSYGDYYVINNTNNTRVRANLYLGSTTFGSFSHWIVSIDRVSSHLTLENGLTWCVHREDNHTFMEWEANDHIIIGVYDSWFCPCDYILINTNMNSHVRASQY